jgi:hypothetical protein
MLRLPRNLLRFRMSVLEPLKQRRKVVTADRFKVLAIAARQIHLGIHAH